MSDKAKRLLFSIIPVLITGALCSYFTRAGVRDWFALSSQPEMMPPNYIFSVAWSIIYVLLMISFYRILSKKSQFKSQAINLYWQQLILQILWCALFFGAKEPLIGGLIIFWLIFTVFKMIRVFLKIDIAAGMMNYPYFAYICFAAFLNLAFLYTNGYIKAF